MTFQKDTKQRFSLRKYKAYGTSSVLLGALTIAGAHSVQADETTLPVSQANQATTIADTIANANFATIEIATDSATTKKPAVITAEPVALPQANPTETSPAPLVASVGESVPATLATDEGNSLTATSKRTLNHSPIDTLPVADRQSQNSAEISQRSVDISYDVVYVDKDTKAVVHKVTKTKSVVTNEPLATTTVTEKGIELISDSQLENYFEPDLSLEKTVTITEGRDNRILYAVEKIIAPKPRTEGTSTSTTAEQPSIARSRRDAASSVQLSIGRADEHASNYNLYAGGEHLLYSKIQIGGTTEKYTDAYVKYDVTVEYNGDNLGYTGGRGHSYIDGLKISGVQSGGVVQEPNIEYEEQDGGSYRIKKSINVPLGNIQSGSFFKLPVTYRNEQNNIPNGANVKITMRLYGTQENESDSKLIQTSEQIFQMKRFEEVVQATIKYVSSIKGETEQQAVVVGEKYRDTDVVKQPNFIKYDIELKPEFVAKYEAFIREAKQLTTDYEDHATLLRLKLENADDWKFESRILYYKGYREEDKNNYPDYQENSTFYKHSSGNLETTIEDLIKNNNKSVLYFQYEGNAAVVPDLTIKVVSPAVHTIEGRYKSTEDRNNGKLIRAEKTIAQHTQKNNWRVIEQPVERKLKLIANNRVEEYYDNDSRDHYSIGSIQESLYKATKNRPTPSNGVYKNDDLAVSTYVTIRNDKVDNWIVPLKKLDIELNHPASYINNPGKEGVDILVVFNKTSDFENVKNATIYGVRQDNTRVNLGKISQMSLKDDTDSFRKDFRDRQLFLRTNENLLKKVELVFEPNTGISDYMWVKVQHYLGDKVSIKTAPFLIDESNISIDSNRERIIGETPHTFSSNVVLTYQDNLQTKTTTTAKDQTNAVGVYLERPRYSFEINRLEGEKNLYLNDLAVSGTTLGVNNYSFEYSYFPSDENSFYYLKVPTGLEFKGEFSDRHVPLILKHVLKNPLQKGYDYYIYKFSNHLTRVSNFFTLRGNVSITPEVVIKNAEKINKDTHTYAFDVTHGIVVPHLRDQNPENYFEKYFSDYGLTPTDLGIDLWTGVDTSKYVHMRSSGNYSVLVPETLAVYDKVFKKGRKIISQFPKQIPCQKMS